MASLDADDPRPPSQQIANALRTAILSRKLRPGEKLPSGPQLVQHYGVAKATVEQAIRILRQEGLVFSRKGSGVYVRERTVRPVGLRPHIERAFSANTITVDFAGFSGETLHGAISEPIDRIREGSARPDSLTVRLLVPDPSIPWAFPSLVVDDLSDSPAFRRRAATILQRHATAIVAAVDELAQLGLVQKATAQIRCYPVIPMFKLYILNGEQAFFGFYPVQEHAIEIEGKNESAWDLMGKDSTLFHFVQESGPESKDTQLVTEAKTWFDSIWNSVARDYQP